IFGVLKAGGAYLPIDPEYPEERIAFMLKDSGARTLLKSEIPNHKSQTNPNDQNTNDPNKKQCSPCLVLNLRHLDFESCFTLRDFGFRISDLSPTGLAYLIYTSGSTGKPKGVMVGHRNLTGYIHSFRNLIDIYPEDVFIQVASYSFDAFVEEVYPILFEGGRIAVPKRSDVQDPERLIKYILTRNITILDCTPLLLDQVNRSVAEGTRLPVRLFISGGDVLKTGHIDHLLKIGKVYNCYGPTETTVCITFYECPGQPGSARDSVVPLGKPLANYRVQILDKTGNLCPIGVAGELCASGHGVTRGYLNRPELTAEKFLDKTYKTGDLAAWMADGNIEFLGRIDQQVKIRGYRIEPGEIEERLLLHNSVKNAVVTARTDAEGDRYLCAYVVVLPGEDNGLLPLTYRDHLAGQLPDYMIPSFFVILESIPLTSNGKVDHKALPVPEAKAGGDYVAPRDYIEKKLVKIWSEVLIVDEKSIGIDNSLFDLGGHSLKAIFM
ncbi:MAG: non-ribosomal peptide synthetase, partial [bacterium]|nr:non-ribosomal peptide synthetase [bacterium]